jgi:hypothetical protein
VIPVFEGGSLNASDKFSFNHPPITSQGDWDTLLTKVWTEAEALATLIEQLPGAKLEETFVDDKYGNYYRNTHGIIEHLHYHLGQIVLIKKIIAELSSN